MMIFFRLHQWQWQEVAYSLTKPISASGTKAPMKRRRAWRRQWPRKEQFCLALIVLCTCVHCVIPLWQVTSRSCEMEFH